MTFMHRALIPALAVLAIVGIELVANSSAASSASSARATAPATFSYTIAGTDMHTLDPHYEAMFVDGGGVTAVVEDLDNTTITYRYFEADLNLPVGAKVTSIALNRKLCDDGGVTDTYVFGSYAPATRNTVQNAVMKAPETCTPKTFTKTGNPITTTVAGRRYALDFLPNITGQYPGSTDPDEVFYGATIKYTCTSPCVP